MLVFSQGNWRAIENNINAVESGAFYDESSPTFGYAGVDKQNIKISLRYSNVDVEGNVVMNKGSGKLEINNNGDSSGKTKLLFRKR